MVDTMFEGSEATFTPAADDYIRGVDDPTGTPVSGNFTVTQLTTLLNTLIGGGPGTSGNVLTSNGTTWESAAAAAPNGWVAVTDTWTYASATTFTIVGNYSAILTKGMKFKLTANSVVLQGYIISAVYSSPNTTVTVIGNALTNHTFTSVYYSTADSPAGFTGLFSYVPNTIDGFASYTTNSFFISISNRTLRFIGNLIGASNANTLSLSLPVTPTAPIAFIPGYALNNSGYVQYGVYGLVSIGSTTLVFNINDGPNWTASNNKGVYFECSVLF